MQLEDLEINSGWTLFLDRDGVLNTKRDNDYVKRWEEFEFLPGVKQALKKLSERFGRIVVVTNQRGIAKGLYTSQDFAEITAAMINEIEDAGGRIDWVFHCPHMGTEMICNCRKPKPGMARQAKEKFPEIDLSRSVMVGDARSDIEFGKFAGMVTVQVNYTKQEDADFHYASLDAFANALGA